jgi:hypothetical protein
VTVLYGVLRDRKSLNVGGVLNGVLMGRKIAEYGESIPYGVLRDRKTLNVVTVLTVC